MGTTHTRRLSPIAVIVVAQLLGTSLWFSPNSAADDLRRAWALDYAGLGSLTSAVQLGFIAGTLLLAVSGLADRYPASRIFAVSCVLGALCNAGFVLGSPTLAHAVIWRAAVGICLAGIYPLGMKLVISWSPGRAGQTLGLLVAMLTLGTALPHGVRALGADWSWQAVVLSASGLAVLGGAAIARLGDGPFLPAGQARRALRWGAALAVFRGPAFRACALGYFGHMWELYAFWTVVPMLVAALGGMHGWPAAQIAAASFTVIAAGAVGCLLAGRLSQRWGSARVAWGALAVSGCMCALYPFLAAVGGAGLIGIGLLIWGMAVIADSAQFSALAAANCPPQQIGSALAIMNSLGFLVTVIPISLVTAQIQHWGAAVAWLLLPGPVLGLFFFRQILRTKPDSRTDIDRTKETS